MEYGGFSSFLPIAASSHVASRGPSPGLLRVCEPQDSHVNLNVWGVIFQEKDHSLKVSPPKVKTPQLLQLPHFMKGPVAWRGVEPHPVSHQQCGQAQLSMVQSQLSLLQMPGHVQGALGWGQRCPLQVSVGHGALCTDWGLHDAGQLLCADGVQL